MRSALRLGRARGGRAGAGVRREGGRGRGAASRAQREPGRGAAAGMGLGRRRASVLREGGGPTPTPGPRARASGRPLLPGGGQAGARSPAGGGPRPLPSAWSLGWRVRSLQPSNPGGVSLGRPRLASRPGNHRQSWFVRLLWLHGADPGGPFRTRGARRSNVPRFTSRAKPGGGKTCLPRDGTDTPPWECHRWRPAEPGPVLQ